MPDIDPAALTSRPLISTTPILPPKTLSSAAPSVQKVSKAQHIPARIDLEPLYTALKLAIGEHWGTYKDAISLFAVGK
jgi:transcriptional coactivator HFI1/ADA1